MKAPGVASHAEEREKNIFVVAGDAIELPLADLSESKYRQEEILFFLVQEPVLISDCTGV